MSDTRMAGDALKGKRKSQLEDRLGTEEFERIGKQGQQAADDKGQWTAAEVISEFRNRDGGNKVDEGADSMVDRFKKIQADGGKFNRRAQDFLSSKYGFDFSKNNSNDGNSDDGTNTGGEPGNDSGGGSEPGNGNPGDGTGDAPGGGNGNGGNASNSNETNQSIGDTTITGDGNIVNNSNSNSNFQQAFGGDSHNFTYNGGGGGSGGGGSAPGGLYDTPASMATMAGYWGANDSAKDTNEFLSKYIGGNRFHQAAMQSEYNDRTDTDYKSQADSVNQFNPMAMQERIDREPLINRSRSTVDFAKLFGDVDNWQQKWNPTTAPSAIESEVGDIAEEYKDDLD